MQAQSNEAGDAPGGKASPAVERRGKGNTAAAEGNEDIRGSEYQLTHHQGSPARGARNAQIPQNCQIAVSKKSSIKPSGPAVTSGILEP